MKKKRIAALAATLPLILSSLSVLGGCSPKETITLRVYNWEEYIDDGGEGSFIYDELHETDEKTKKISEIESDLVDDAYMARYEEETGVPFDKNGPDIITDFEHWYEKTYGTAVRVEYSTFGTNEDLYNQLKLGNKYDLVCPSEYMIMKLAAENMIQPLEKSFFDETDERNYYVKNVSRFIQDKFETGTIQTADSSADTKHWSDYAAGYMWGTTGLVYNPETVSEEDLARDGWSIIINPVYKRKVTTKDNVRDSYFVALAILYRDELLGLKEHYENGTLSEESYNESVTQIMNRVDGQTISEIEKILLKMKENIFGFETDTGKSDMVKGTISINFAWSGDAVYAMDEAEDDGLQLNFYIPSESANLFFDGWVIPKDDSRSDKTTQAAHAFINYMSLPHNAVRNSYYIGYTSVIAGDEMFEYADYMYGAEEDGVEYDLSYFFGADSDYTIFAPEEQLQRQLYAQYPPQSATPRCAVMDYYGKEADDTINELWTHVKGESLDAWAIVVICVAVVAVAGGFLLMRFGGKIDFFRRKPKKGYTLVKQENIR